MWNAIGQFSSRSESKALIARGIARFSIAARTLRKPLGAAISEPGIPLPLPPSAYPPRAVRSGGSVGPGPGLARALGRAA